MDMINEWIREQFARTGLSQVGLANKLGLNPTQVSRILSNERKVKVNELRVIEDYFQAKYRAEDSPGTQEYTLVKGQQPVTVALPTVFDVPEYGVAAGGASVQGLEYDFSLNGVVVNYVARPQGIARLKQPYLIRMVGDSMSPRYNEGEPIYVDPDRPPVVGDFVVLQLEPQVKGDPCPALVKRLAGRTDTHIKLSQFNPDKTFQVAKARVRSMHRVIPWPELIGL